MSELIEQVRLQLMESIQSDAITLPTLPEVALNVREAAADPNATVTSLCGVIERDAAVTARIIKVSNSPLFRGNNVIENLRMAATRLGINYTSNLATGLAMEQMFQATTETIDNLLRLNWSKATEIAGVAMALAHYCSGLKPEQASLAGLVHRIGVLPILTFAEEHRKLLGNQDTLLEVIDALHPEIGAQILRSWNFPDELVEVPLNYLQFDRQAEVADYADLVTIATLQCAQGAGDTLSNVDLSQVTAFERLGLSHDIESMEGEDINEQIELASTAFS